MLNPDTIFDGRYTIIAPLGRGGMGQVYKAQQKDMDRLVALKVLAADQFSGEAIARLEREAVALATLNHPGIIKVYGYGVCAGAPYIVLEYVEGQTLQARLRNGEPLPVPQTLDLLKQICDAIKYTHEKGIVHRDLKPDNIMLVEKDDGISVKLIDLGLARILPESGHNVQKLTETGSAIGSVLYMSPEQCLGQKADARSDIYSLGVIMHYCLTGKHPFNVENAIAAMMLQVNEAPPLLVDVNPEANLPGLQAVVSKSIAKKPEERYQNAESMAADLLKIEQGAGQTITAVHVIVSTRKSMRTAPPRKKALIAVIGVTAGLLLSAFFLLRDSTAPFQLFSGSSSRDLLKTALAKWDSGDLLGSYDLLSKALLQDRKEHSFTFRSIPTSPLNEACIYYLNQGDPRAEPFIEKICNESSDYFYLSDNKVYSWIEKHSDEQHLSVWKEILTTLASTTPRSTREQATRLDIISRTPLSPRTTRELGPLVEKSLQRLGTSSKLDLRYSQLWSVKLSLASAYNYNGQKQDARRMISSMAKSRDQFSSENYSQLAYASYKSEDWKSVLLFVDLAGKDYDSRPDSAALKFLSHSHLNERTQAAIDLDRWLSAARKYPTELQYALVTDAIGYLVIRNELPKAQDLRREMRNILRKNQSSLYSMNASTYRIIYKVPSSSKWLMTACRGFEEFAGTASFEDETDDRAIISYSRKSRNEVVRTEQQSAHTKDMLPSQRILKRVIAGMPVSLVVGKTTDNGTSYYWAQTTIATTHFNTTCTFSSPRNATSEDQFVARVDELLATIESVPY